ADLGLGGRVEGAEAGLPHDRCAAGRGFDREAALVVGDGEAAVDAVAVGAGGRGLVEDRVVLGVAVGEGAHPGHAVQFDLGNPWDPAVDGCEVAQDLPGGVGVDVDLDRVVKLGIRRSLPERGWRPIAYAQATAFTSIYLYSGRARGRIEAMSAEDVLKALAEPR